MKTAIFLGAGASAAEGAPIQSELFKKYFGSHDPTKQPAVDGGQAEKQLAVYRDLSEFFKAMFGINLEDPLDSFEFPTFEEALGILDLAEARRESFRGFDFAGAVPTGNKVQLLRLDLVLVMSKAIADGIREENEPRYHEALVTSLDTQGLLEDTVFVSTNYDLLIDSALGFRVDYGVEFTGTHRFGSSETSGPAARKLLKIHGSLNWLYCPVCNKLTSYETKVVLDLMNRDQRAITCGFCSGVMTYVIVPPTFYKDMSRVFLSTIWNKTENALRDVDRIIFCGYSLPDADMHVKYLLKRIQTNRSEQENSVKFILVNHREGKDQIQAETEKKRYLRFFGKNVIDTGKRFQDFAQDPLSFYLKEA